ncbi:MAG: hypothetical protein JO267_06995 [Alphaproteobacteria bacterium]|nr:hypothetical protein [Alphaproteobacteria bacterium]
MPLPAIQPIGIGTAAAYSRQAWQATLTNPLVMPGDTNPPIIFEPPPALTNGTNEVWLAASGGPDWGGCEIWVSLDGDTYSQIGTISRGCVTGVLTSPFPAHASPDTTDTLAVDLTESQGQLLSGTVAEAQKLATLCWVDGELISYETATLIAVNKYGLSGYLVRGAYGTPITAHSAAASFARINGLLFRYTFAANLIGQTIYLKLPAFNNYGQSVQDLSSVTATVYTLTGSGTNPLANPLLSALAGTTSQEWGTVGTTVIATADLGMVTAATGLDVNLGTLP